MYSFTRSVVLFDGRSSYTICHFRLCYFFATDKPRTSSTLQDMECGRAVLHSCAYLAVLHSPLPCPLTVYGEITNFNLSAVLMIMHINARHGKELFCLILIDLRRNGTREATVTTLVARMIIPVLVTIPLNIVLAVH
jgi:hypothetical protein